MTTNVQESQRRLHKEASSARMKRDEDDVKKVFEVISNWRNPFEPSEELLSLSSGYVASESMKADLLLAKEKGTTALTAFVEERLVTNSTGFFQTLPKLKLRSFRDAQKKTSVTAGDRNFIIRADRNLFARLLVIGQSRQMDLKDLLSHELGPLPWSLASSDGSLAKTNKAILSKLLENGVECLPTLPDLTTAVIIDAMAMLQTLVRIPNRFCKLVDMAMTRILIEAGQAARIDFVGDQYTANSIKNTENNKRGRDGEIVINITNGQQFCPRRGKSSRQKEVTKLVSQTSLHVSGQKMRSTPRKSKSTLSLSLMETISPNSLPLMVQLLYAQSCSNQEEADTRMLLHANNASQHGHQHIAIRSSDTDVEVLAYYY